jgi:hypothetical protein
MNVPLSSLRIVRVVVVRVGSGVGELGGITGVTGEAAVGGILANGESHAAVMTSKANRAVKRRITPTPFVTVEFAKSRRRRKPCDATLRSRARSKDLVIAKSPATGVE